MLTVASTSSLNQGIPSSYVVPFFDWSPIANGSQSARFFCRVGNYTAPTPPGDYVGRLAKDLGTINRGASKSVTFIYRRF